MAQKRGMATGLIATSRITHATPASFAAHVPSRVMEWEIGRQILDHNVTVVMGGGAGIYDPAKRPDSLDLRSRIMERYTYLETLEELAALDLDTVSTLFGLFAVDHMPRAVWPTVTLRDTIIQIVRDSATTVADTSWVPYRSPTLPDMTEAALAVLDKDPDGFFLMVEASQPDWRGHGNEPLATVEAEMLDLDRAVGVALEYRQRNPETLIVVLADHETGGLSLQFDSTGTFQEAYTTLSHTAEMVPLFAIGPGAQRFAGIIPNYRVGQLLIDAVRGTELGGPE
jgi:alkaline phosphatase